MIAEKVNLSYRSPLFVMRKCLRISPSSIYSLSFFLVCKSLILLLSLSPLSVVARVSDPVKNLPDQDSTSQDKPDSDPWFLLDRIRIQSQE